MPLKHQQGKARVRQHPIASYQSFSTDVAEYKDALAAALEAIPTGGIQRIRTKRTRILEAAGNSTTPRKTTGWRLRRTFTFVIV